MPAKAPSSAPRTAPEALAEIVATTSGIMGFRAILWLLLLAAMAGCSGTEDPGGLENYLTRLGRSLDRDIPSPELIRPPRIREAALRPLPVQGTGIDLLDFMALSGCELQINLGRRNSSLGRHAPPSQALLLDLEYLRLAPACLTYLRQTDKAELAEVVATVAEDRRQDLSRRIYNAVLAGPEFADLWQLPPSLGDYPMAVGGDVIDSLNYLAEITRAWLSGQYARDDGELEFHLSRLRAGDGGSLMLAAALQARQLDRGSRMLDSRRKERPLCQGGLASTAAKTAETVATRFFVTDVQVWLAQLSQRQRALLAPIQDLEASLGDTLPPEYRRWANQRGALLAQLQQAPRAHVEALKAALEDCPDVSWR